ncbi:kelch-like protein [Corallococcus praedator]|uniref:Kelch-like protein n=1 Tax=Corallococcus praedator TaxID=2316724 RepID=A0ABX9QCX5_9BACT|nr:MULTISPECIES: kelch motif-containing protein [Corallococcus]RKH23561.1 kelch-like protein [Corallococcus sp. CA031C]RKH98994.1 kelch-like protein [Corallococcus praedator]
MPSLRSLPSLAAVLLLSLAACISEPTGEPTGSVQFAATAQQALSANDATRVKVTISATEMGSLVVELAKVSGAWGGILGNIPVGSNRTFLAEAFDSAGTKIFQGQTSGVSITANQTTAVAITLQEIVPPPPYGNEAPLIESVVASATTVQTGASITLSSTVRDPNTADTLTQAWTASSGSFSTSTSTSTSWTAPSSTGIQTLTLTVTDSQGAASSFSLSVNVVSGAATGSGAVNLSFNLWPVVSKVSPSRTRLDVGQSVSVSANASDANGDTLSYQWATTATCPGTWTNATSSAASFVPSSVPSAACNNCQLTVTVQDGRGGQTTGSINLCIAAASTERFVPTITNFYQTANTTSPGQTVTFSVTALDPQSSALTFGWSASIGSLATAQNTASTSQIVWTAPSCAVTGASFVTAGATNAYGLTASKSFSASGLPACATGWAGAGTLTAARQHHTATLLSSGKVLVSGGYDSVNGNLASAEVYDPATNSWSSAGTMATARRLHTATLLSSGKVLVTGGIGNSGLLPSTEVYDPATNSWSSAGTMATARNSHTATALLPSGKVLVTGGSGSNGHLASAEVYDPATNAWSSAGRMTTARYYHTATALLSSGKVLVAGGSGSSGTIASPELYDLATNSWSSAGTMVLLRRFHAATLLSSGKVLVTGGIGGGHLSSAEVYDPATNSWSSVVSMPIYRESHTAILLSSGKVLVSGGHDSINYLTSAVVYDPATNVWSSVGDMPTARYNHTAILLPSGRVLIAGGINPNYVPAAMIYTP